MKLQILVATMHQNDTSLLDRMNIRTDAIVVNQCDRTSYSEINYKNHKILWIDTCQRGLSKSRNMALSYATADICLIADDDVVYNDDYEKLILDAFKNNTKADILTFNFTATNAIQTRKPRTNRRAPFYRFYASVSLAFRRIKIVKYGLHFNELIGAGSDYGAGEESLFLSECRHKHLKIYENSAYIARVDFSESTWFKGYDEKFYFDTGIYLGVTYGKAAYLFSLYYLLQSRKIANMHLSVVFKQMSKGIKAFRKL